jgi:hypothetical protein
MDSQEGVRDSCIETSSHDRSWAISIKLEGVSDVEEEEVSMPIAFQEVKDEWKASHVSVSSLLGRFHTYPELPFSFSYSYVCPHEIPLL